MIETERTERPLVRRRRVLTLAVAGLFPWLSISCAPLLKGRHNGVRYTIQPDRRWHRIESDKDGPFIYDSLELTVESHDGRLIINGEDSGSVEKGDHVQIDHMGTVFVNGTRRGDALTGKAENASRILQTNELLETSGEG